MLAMVAHAVEEAMVRSQSLASRRQRPSHAKVRSTTQRRGNSTKPLAVSERLMISSVQSPCPLCACLSLSPAYQSRPCGSPIVSITTVNHKPLVSLNYFPFGLLAICQ